jgi:putative thioredoxin
VAIASRTSLPQAGVMPETPSILDVDDRTFERDVLDRSRDVPVVVDFWAPWCAPCRALGPVLERLAREHAGAFVLAKVNVDESPAVAQTFAIQSIPAVKAFRDGAEVAQFVGAQPEAVVRQFLTTILPTEADRRAQVGEARVAARDAAGAEAAFKEALAHDARQPRALLGLARLYAEQGKEGEALPLLERISPNVSVAREAERLAAQLRTRADGTGDEATLRARVAATPADLDARLALGRLLAAQGKHEEALAQLLEVVRSDPHWADDAARKTMLDVFEILGSQDPLTDRYRGELAKALFR